MFQSLAEDRGRNAIVEPIGLLRQFSEWVEWMKRELTVSGIDLPSDEMCVLFAASAVRLADRVQGIYSHVPTSLRARLIQAAILHQSWNHQVKVRQKGGVQNGIATQFPVLDALDLAAACTSTEPAVIATDGHTYRVRFPQPAPRNMELITEVICFLLAKEMGLRVPQIRAMRVTQQTAARLGIL